MYDVILKELESITYRTRKQLINIWNNAIKASNFRSIF